ncbi:MAG: hypothetical protein Q9167_004180 [Letrouitia subvulpina]
MLCISLAITDSRPQAGDTPREMKICPRFFTAPETKSDLSSKTYDKAERARNSWCKIDPPLFKNFETAGHTLLHEMTHLDAVGRAAGFQPQGNPPSHGTDDVDGFGDDYVTAARGFLDAWVNSPDELAENALQPFQNAENLAAAATDMQLHKHTHTNRDLSTLI